MKMRRFKGGTVASEEAPPLYDTKERRREREEGAWRGGREKKVVEGEERERKGWPWDPIWAMGASQAHQRRASLAGSHPAMCQHLLGDGGYPRLVGCTPGAPSGGT